MWIKGGENIETLQEQKQKITEQSQELLKSMAQSTFEHSVHCKCRLCNQLIEYDKELVRINSEIRKLRLAKKGLSEEDAKRIGERQTREANEYIRVLLDDGWSDNEIANHLNFEIEYIRVVSRKYSKNKQKEVMEMQTNETKSIETKTTDKPIDKEIILKEKQNGLSAAEIADKYGWAYQSVYYHYSKDNSVQTAKPTAKPTPQPKQTDILTTILTDYGEPLKKLIRDDVLQLLNDEDYTSAENKIKVLRAISEEL